MNPAGNRLRAVPVLIALNVVVFLYQSTLASPQFVGIYALSWAGIRAGLEWQLLTHAFLHGNTLHLLFNMLGLWFAGRIVERILGTGRFLILFLVSALSGGVFQLLFGGPGLLLGASGAVCGILVAFATLFPENRVMVLLFFLPIRLRAKYLGYGLAGTSLVFLVTGLFPIIGHAAHLGGCVAGFLFIRLTARLGLKNHRPLGGSTSAPCSREDDQLPPYIRET